ncbi:hypothetical protein FHS59_002724 [Algoriphagus iocasae]|jgi:hypothetical protein|uniref:Uncharacterized protein n=1 Tax=Algoriphagus iocasae TaxID=1836499 RepID=A0A841MSI3_9BACT|nr:hypothetical protein [Algoriphagus iocasae]MBB6327096.1 hypothetical protein [Algoriphagus iocasae]
MFKNRFKLFLASFVFALTLMGGVTSLNAQSDVWCKWDENLQSCWSIADDGYCAVSFPHCDVPVVE